MRHFSSRRRTRRWIERGLLTHDGLELTPTGERIAERSAEERHDRDIDDDYRMPHGWAPDPCGDDLW